MTPFEIKVTIDLSPATVSVLSRFFATGTETGQWVPGASNSRIAGAQPAAEPVMEEPPATPAPRRGRPPKQPAAAVATDTGQDDAPLEPDNNEASGRDGAPEDSAVGEVISVEQVRAAVTELAKKDREAARALLAKHGSTSVSGLDEKHYAAVLQAARA